MHATTSTIAAQSAASRTAFDCAAVRASVFASTHCADADYLALDLVRGPAASPRARLAALLLRLGAHRLTRWIAERTSPGADVFMFARTAVPDDLARQALTDDPRTQVVLLGAGLDTSGLRIGKERALRALPPGRFFEVDLPATQRAKRALVKRLLSARPELSDAHVTYVACTFGEAELATALRGASFDPTAPTLWVWSGVVHYLPDATNRAVISELRRLSAPGSVLFFDYVLLEAYEKPEALGFASTKRRFDRMGEKMSFGFSSDVEHVRSWLHEQAWQLVKVFDHVDMVNLFEEKASRPCSSSGTPWARLCIAQTPLDASAK